MSKKACLALVILVGLTVAAIGAVSEDGIYRTGSGYYVASPDEIVDVQAQRQRRNSTSSIFADIQTNFNVDVDTQSPENEPIRQTQVSATFNASKGPVYFQYSHNRQYVRSDIIDPLYVNSITEFQGTVNNRFTVGVSFSPAVAARDNSAHFTASNTTPVQDSKTIGASSVN